MAYGRTTDFGVDSSVELAHWLVEAAARRWPTTVSAATAAAAIVPRAIDLGRERLVDAKQRRVALLTAAAIAYMPFWYADIMTRIYGIHSLIVFVFSSARI